MTKKHVVEPGLEPGSPEWLARVAQVAAETECPEGSLWWLSFVDSEQPEGGRFLGACWVEASNLVEALTVSHDLGINPGGEVAIAGPILVDGPVDVPDRFLRRLLSRDDIAEMDKVLETR